MSNLKSKIVIAAIAAITLTMAGCGDEPEQAPYQIDVQTLSETIRFTIHPANNEEEYFWWVSSAKNVEAFVSPDQYVKDNILVFVSSYDEIKFVKGPMTHTSANRNPDTKYFIGVTRVDHDLNIIGHSFIQECKTQPYGILPGVFSLSADKKVQFSTCNLIKTSSGYDRKKQQWYYLGSDVTLPCDLLPWWGTMTLDNDCYLPSADEWYYLFKERPRADELFAHATVAGTHGIIILPDDWQTPEGINLETAKQMGMVWDEDGLAYGRPYSQFNGYERNVFSSAEWVELEYAGAVFLPAVGFDGKLTNGVGYYWSSTEYTSGFAHHFDFGDDNLDLYALRNTSHDKKGHFSVRLIQEVQ